MTQLYVFVTAIGLGLVGRVLYFLCAVLAKSTRLKAMGYILDVVFCMVMFVLFVALVVFVAGGIMQAHLLLGLFAGFFLGSIPFSAIGKRKLERQPPETKVQTNKDTALKL